MRLERKKARRWGRRSQVVQRQKRAGRECLRRPEAGTVLSRITVEDCVAGTSMRIVVRQGRRKNQVVPEVFGRQGQPVGWDRIMRRLRALCVCRWIEEDF
jgi:hypothetical protein